MSRSARTEVGIAISRRCLAALALLALFSVPATADIENTAAATGTYGGEAVRSNEAEASVPLAEVSPSVKLDLLVPTSVDGFDQPGDVVVFDVIVTNTGDVTFTTVVFESATAETIVCPVDGSVELAPLETIKCALRRTTTAGDIANRQMISTVTAKATAAAGAAEPAVATAQVDLLEANIVTTISLTNGVAMPREGDGLTFTVTATNRGPADASGVVVAARLPAGLSYVSGTASEGYQAETGAWTVGALDAGETVSLDISATVDPGTAAQTLESMAEVSALDQIDSITAGDVKTAVVEIATPVVSAGDDTLGDVTMTLWQSATPVVTDIANVLSNDMVNNLPAPVGDVTITMGEASPGAPFTINPDGGIDIVAEVPAGIYRQAYRICQMVNPWNCADAIVEARIDPVPLNATDDSVSDPANGRDGAESVLNILANDTQGGKPVRPAKVTATPVSEAADLIFRINADGSVDVLPGAPGGVQSLPYRVCENLNQENCAEATLTLPIVIPAALSGHVFIDTNGTGAFEPEGDTALERHTVALEGSAAMLAETDTDSSGRYQLPLVPAGNDYRLIVRGSDGSVTGALSALSVAPGNDRRDLNLEIGPTGIVYDFESRLPVAGAVISVTDKSGADIAAACFAAPAQQRQLTGADGAYRFDIIPGADASCPRAETEYRIAVTAPDGYKTEQPLLALPLAGPLDLTGCVFDTVPGNACQPVSDALPLNEGRSPAYLMTFLLQAGDPALLHNHIPLERKGDAAPLIVSATVPGGAVSQSDGAEVVIEVKRADDAFAGPIRVTGLLPAGFAYQGGSFLLNGAATEPAAYDPVFDTGLLTLGEQEEADIRFTLVAEAGSTRGAYSSRIRVLDADGNALAADTTLVITVTDEQAANCPEISGRVFDDINADGLSDRDEKGIPGVRLEAGDGTLARTDSDGRFRVVCVSGANAQADGKRTLTLDVGTLPDGYSLTTDNPAIVAESDSRMVELDFGATRGRIVRLDLKDEAFEAESDELKPEWRAGLDGLSETLRERYSVLHIHYETTASDALAESRTARLSQEIEHIWQAGDPPYSLEVEIEIARN